jgi:competence CoiA-like predicted nuclease
MPKATTCHLDGRLIEVDKAIILRSQADIQKTARPEFRCRECGKPVKPHRTGTTNQQAHFEHHKKNQQCLLGSR